MSQSTFQNIKVGDNSTIDPSALVEFKSTTGGMLVPRMTTTQRLAISTPANGLIVYDSTLTSFYGYSNGAWAAIGSGGGGSGITALTGDVTASGTGSVAATLATVATPGTSPKVTFNAKGLVTSGTTLASGDIPNNAANTSGTAATFTGNLTGDVTSTAMATTVVKINGTSLAGLTTGILKNTTTTGVPSIAVAVDFPTLNQNTTGNAATVTTNANLTGDVTSSGNATTVVKLNGTTLSGLATGILKNTTATGVPSIAVSGTDYVVPAVTTLSSLSLPASQVTGLVAATGATATPAASTISEWDANKNMSGNNFLEGFTTIATAAGTTTLSVTSTYEQVFTGSTTQTVVLPVAATLVNGFSFIITNLSTGVVTVQTSGSNAIQAMASNTSLNIACINTAGGTGTASWQWVYAGAQSTLLPAAAGTLTGTTLAATVVTSSLTTVGTIGTGVWSGTAVATTKGGTGQTSVIVAPAASTYAGWDANKNLSANATIDGFTTTATAAGTTTMTIASTKTQYWTGSTTQTVKLPTTSIVAGGQYYIFNQSTGVVTVQSSAANTIVTLSANTGAYFTALVATPTTAANWDFEMLPSVVGSSSGNVYTSTGATSAPTWQAVGSSPTGNYWSGSTANNTAPGWQYTTTSLADPSTSSANTLTTRKSSGITVTAAATNLPGIVFTPGSSSQVFLITANFSATAGSLAGDDGTFSLTDGTTVIAQRDMQPGVTAEGNEAPMTLTGIYAPANTSANTIKIQGAASAGTAYIVNAGSLAPAIEWTVLRIN